MELAEQILDDLMIKLDTAKLTDGEKRAFLVGVTTVKATAIRLVSQGTDPNTVAAAVDTLMDIIMERLKGSFTQYAPTEMDELLKNHAGGNS